MCSYKSYISQPPEPLNVIGSLLLSSWANLMIFKCEFFRSIKVDKVFLHNESKMLIWWSTRVGKCHPVLKKVIIIEIFSQAIQQISFGQLDPLTLYRIMQDRYRLSISMTLVRLDTIGSIYIAYTACGCCCGCGCCSSPTLILS